VVRKRVSCERWQVPTHMGKTVAFAFSPQLSLRLGSLCPASGARLEVCQAILPSHPVHDWSILISTDTTPYSEIFLGLRPFVFDLDRRLARIAPSGSHLTDQGFLSSSGSGHHVTGMN
jgi:hypothetical protein